MGVETQCYSWRVRFLVLIVAVFLPLLSLSFGIIGSFLFTFSVPVIFQFVIAGKTLTSFGLKRCLSVFPVFIGILSGFVMGTACGMLVKISGISGRISAAANGVHLSWGSFFADFALSQELGYRLLMQSNTPVGFAVYALFSLMLIGLGEELFWRGFLLRRVMKYFPAPKAVGIVSLLFAASHCYLFLVLPIPAGLFLIALIGIAGVCWAILALMYDSLWPSVVSHGIAAFILWKYFFFSS
jgi:membrane protease YdiL (CAAX protease family)